MNQELKLKRVKSIMEFNNRILLIIKQNPQLKLYSLNFIKILHGNMKELMEYYYHDSIRTDLEKFYKQLNGLFKASEYIYDNESEKIMEEFPISIPERIKNIDAYEYKISSPPLVLPAIRDIKYKKMLKIQNEVAIICPYQTYDHVLQFIEQMCDDKDINEIYISIYRVAKDSRIIKALLNAKKYGKRVNVFAETKAKGDESKNNKLTKTLRKHGIIVTNDLDGTGQYKMHGKMFLAISNKDLFYHISTGNYNEKNAKTYTDINIIGCDRKIGNAMHKIFLSLMNQKKLNFSSLLKLENLSKNDKNKTIFISPNFIRDKLVRLINEEIKKKRNGRIWLKCNGLIDEEIEKMLTYARKVGVDVRLIIRGNCGFDVNLKKKCKLGEYLEHSRIYILGNRVYIASADLLPRNLYERVEIMYEVQNLENKKTLKKYFKHVYGSEDILII